MKVIKLLDKTGYKNPFIHLRTWYWKGKSLVEQDSNIYGLYEETHKKEALGGTFCSYFHSECL